MGPVGDWCGLPRLAAGKPHGQQQRTRDRHGAAAKRWGRFVHRILSATGRPHLDPLHDHHGVRNAPSGVGEERHLRRLAADAEAAAGDRHELLARAACVLGEEPVAGAHDGDLAARQGVHADQPIEAGDGRRHRDRRTLRPPRRIDGHGARVTSHPPIVRRHGKERLLVGGFGDRRRLGNEVGSGHPGSKAQAEPGGQHGLAESGELLGERPQHRAHRRPQRVGPHLADPLHVDAVNAIDGPVHPLLLLARLGFLDEDQRQHRRHRRRRRLVPFAYPHLALGPQGGHPSVRCSGHPRLQRAGRRVPARGAARHGLRSTLGPQRSARLLLRKHHAGGHAGERHRLGAWHGDGVGLGGGIEPVDPPAGGVHQDDGRRRLLEAGPIPLEQHRHRVRVVPHPPRLSRHLPDDGPVGLQGRREERRDGERHDDPAAGVEGREWQLAFGRSSGSGVHDTRPLRPQYRWRRTSRDPGLELAPTAQLHGSARALTLFIPGLKIAV